MTSTTGQRIAHARSLAGLSGHQLARSIGLTSLNTISQYETGKRHPQPGRLRAIAEATDVNLEWLAHGTGEPRAIATRDDVQLDRLERKLDRVLATQQTLIDALGINAGADGEAAMPPTRDRADLVVDAVARGSRAAQRTRAPQSPRASQRTTR